MNKTSQRMIELCHETKHLFPICALFVWIKFDTLFWPGHYLRCSAYKNLHAQAILVHEASFKEGKKIQRERALATPSETAINHFVLRFGCRSIIY